MSTPGSGMQNMVVREGPSKGSTISSEIMVAAIVFFFFVVIVLIFLRAYAKSRWRGRTAHASRRSPLIVYAAADGPVKRGLEPAVLASLPVSVYRAEDFKSAGGLECSVCLSELADGDKARILPKCNHGFHLNCIDMWFYSHVTCPLCRRAVHGGTDLLSSPGVDFTVTVDSSAATSAVPANTESPHPAEEGGASTSEGTLVIEIPSRPTGPGLGFCSEVVKSPVPSTPTLSRLRSMRRILSRERREPSEDIEQGTWVERDGRATLEAPLNAPASRR